MKSHEAEQIDEIRQRLATIVRRELFVSKERIEDHDELIADLGIDSANMAIGLVAIEEQFGTKLAFENIRDCRTFGDLVAAISRSLEAG